MMGIGEFFEKTTGFTPTIDQGPFLEALIDISRPKVLGSCGRQTGKSLCSADSVLWWIFEYPKLVKAHPELWVGYPEKVDVLLMSAMDSYVYDHIEQTFHRNPDLLEQVVAEGVSGLVPLRGFSVKNGSRVHVRGSTSKQVRGLGCDVLVVDEAEEIPDIMLTTALGNLRGKICKCVWLGTAHKFGLFTQVAQNPAKYGFAAFTWSEENCSWHSKESLRTKKLMMSHQQYKVEVLGQTLTMADRALFSTKHLDKCIYETIAKENAPNSRIEAGIDWGFEPASTVLCITERIFNRRRMLNIKGWEKKPIEAIAPEIAKILEDYKVALVKADARPPEYKHQIEKYTKIPIYYIEGNMHKDAMLSQLQRKIRQHSLELAQGELTLITRLRKYRKDAKRNDDYVDALALSCYEPAEALEARPTPTVII